MTREGKMRFVQCVFNMVSSGRLGWVGSNPSADRLVGTFFTDHITIGIKPPQQFLVLSLPGWLLQFFVLPVWEQKGLAQGIPSCLPCNEVVLGQL